MYHYLFDMMSGKMFSVLYIFSFVFYVSCTYNAEIVYQLLSVDYLWNDNSQRQAAINSGEYVIENNIITGIKVAGSDVYVTVPRWRYGVPATLNVLVTNVAGSTVLKPFPSWGMNQIGNCSALQYVQSMEIDPNTGYMWIIDTGRVNTRETSSTRQNLCPPKLVILDLKTSEVMRQYMFPNAVVSHTTNFMNDIVLDYVNGRARYAYITDTADAKLYVYDYDDNNSYFFHHDNMLAQPLLPGQQNFISAPIDGIAISAEFNYVYYSTLTDHRLYAVSTRILRNSSSDFVKNVTLVGNKTGGSDGMVCGQKSLFYAAFEKNAVAKAMVPEHGVANLSTENIVVSNNSSVVWVDTFAFNGTDLWFVANKLNSFFRNQMNFKAGAPNMFIWKVDVNEPGYLYRAIERTNFPSVPGIVG